MTPTTGHHRGSDDYMKPDTPEPVTTIHIPGPDPRTLTPEGWVVVFAAAIPDGQGPAPGDAVTVVLDDGSRDLWRVLVADGPPSRRYCVLGPT